MKNFLLSVALLCTPVLYAQDIIVTLDSEHVESKVEEVSSEQIKYRKWSNPNGPLFVMPTNQIQLIVYENHEVQVFNDKVENKVAKEKTKNTEQHKDTTFEHKISPSPLVVYIEASGVVGKEVTKALTGYNMELYPVIGGPEILAIFGGNVKDIVFIGGGLGLNTAFGYFQDVFGQKTTHSALHIPLFVNTRFFIPVNSKSTKPVAELYIGPNIPTYIWVKRTYVSSVRTYEEEYRQRVKGTLSAFFRVGASVEINRLIIGAGYELWGNDTDCDHYAYFKLGVRLGKM